METEELRAKRILRKRLDIETAFSRRMRREIYDTFCAMARLGYAEKVQAQYFRLSKLKDKDEYEKYLSELRTRLFLLMLNASQRAADIVDSEYGSDEPLEIEDYINEEKNGKTARQRIAIYTNRFKYEAESWIAAGLLRGYSLDELEAEYLAYDNKPYSNPLFREAETMKSSATRLITGGITFGVGLYVSALNSLDRLGRYTIADSFRLAQFLSWGSHGKDLVGYMVGRGSSYPCELCQGMVGFHSTGFGELPPYHSHCCCWAYPVFGTPSLVGEDFIPM